MSRHLDTILDNISCHRDALQPVREILLANAMMIGEIPCLLYTSDAADE